MLPRERGGIPGLCMKRRQRLGCEASHKLGLRPGMTCSRLWHADFVTVGLPMSLTGALVGRARRGSARLLKNGRMGARRAVTM